MFKQSKKPAKIMEFLFGLGIGGLENGVVNFVLNIDRSKFSPIVCCLGERMSQVDLLEKNGVKVYCMRRNLNAKGYSSIFRISALLKNEKIALIHTHNKCGYLYGVPAAMMAGTPVVVHTEHGCSFPESRSLTLLRRLLSCKINYIVTRSGFLADEIHRYWNIRLSKIKSIASGIDASKFERDFNKADIRRKLGFGLNDYLVGIVARLELVKDHDTLIRAIAITKKKLPNVKLVLAGDGSMKRHLKELATELDMIDSVYFLGERTEVAEMLSTLDLFALTSKKEGTSTALMEAMAAGLPIIATDVGGNSELIKDEYNGLLIPPGNPDVLSDSIVELLSNPERRKALGANGKEVFNNKYRFDRFLNDYQDLFGKLLWK